MPALEKKSVRVSDPDAALDSGVVLKHVSVIAKGGVDKQTIKKSDDRTCRLPPGQGGGVGGGGGAHGQLALDSVRNQFVAFAINVSKTSVKDGNGPLASAFSLNARQAAGGKAFMRMFNSTAVSRNHELGHL